MSPAFLVLAGSHLPTKICVLHFGILQQILPCIMQPDAAGFQYIAPVCKVQRLMSVLLYQKYKYRDAFLPKMTDDLEDLFDHHWRQP